MIKEPQITLFDLTVCLSDAIDLVCPALVHHHKQVSFISASIGEAMGLSNEILKDLVLAGALHDIGALSLSDRLETLSFETNDMHDHATKGNLLLSLFEPFSHIGTIVRHHHRYWNNNQNAANGIQVPLESYIIHCADRIAVQINSRDNILSQVDEIVGKIKEYKKMFMPEVVEAFCKIAQREQFWLDIVSSTVFRVLRQKVRLQSLVLNLDELKKLALFFSHIIDFRSKFTATHSCGVAATAQLLAGYAGFSKRECEIMGIAGHVHDLGKLAIPKEILEKPGKLTKEEFEIIRTHTYHTYRILDTLQDFDTINTWASFHHERLNGNGYPFHHNGDVLSLGSRIMCVADVFTAITEDRPYRKGMSPEDTVAVLKTMARENSLDGRIVALLMENIPEVNKNRIIAQSESARQYRELFPN